MPLSVLFPDATGVQRGYGRCKGVRYGGSGRNDGIMAGDALEKQGESRKAEMARRTMFESTCDAELRARMARAGASLS